MVKKSVFGLMVVLLASIVGASLDIEVSCDDKDCKEGTWMNYNVEIYNNIDKDIVVGEIYLKEVVGKINYIAAVTGDKEGFKNEYGKFIYLNKDETIPISAGKRRVIKIRKKVIPPTKGYTFYYIPCMRVVIYNEGKVSSYGDVCMKVVKSYNTVPLSKIECEEDFVCGYDGKCVFYKCEELKCEEKKDENSITGMVALNHNCVANNFWNRILRFFAKILAL